MPIVQTIPAPVSGIIGDAVSALQELGSECREVVDAVEGTGLRETGRIQSLDETASALEDISEPDVPERLDTDEVVTSYLEHRTGRRTGLPRRLRCDNAVAALRACIEAVASYREDRRLELLEMAEDDSKWEDLDQLISDLEQLESDLEEIADAADGCEFPGMRG